MSTAAISASSSISPGARTTQFSVSTSPSLPTEAKHPKALPLAQPREVAKSPRPTLQLHRDAHIVTHIVSPDSYSPTSLSSLSPLSPSPGWSPYASYIELPDSSHLIPITPQPGSRCTGGYHGSNANREWGSGRANVRGVQARLEWGGVVVLFL